MEETLERIRRQLEEHPVLLYMKGAPMAPQCGFSARVVTALMSCGERFSYVDVLQHPDIRSELPKYADWPTFPQLWVNGELIGGCDIVTAMHERGELQGLVRQAAQEAASGEQKREV